jgi:hypothetical protein
MVLFLITRLALEISLMLFSRSYYRFECLSLCSFFSASSVLFLNLSRVGVSHRGKFIKKFLSYVCVVLIYVCPMYACCYILWSVFKVLHIRYMAISKKKTCWTTSLNTVDHLQFEKLHIHAHVHRPILNSWLLQHQRNSATTLQHLQLVITDVKIFCNIRGN